MWGRWVGWLCWALHYPVGRTHRALCLNLQCFQPRPSLVSLVLLADAFLPYSKIITTDGLVKIPSLVGTYLNFSTIFYLFFSIFVVFSLNILTFFLRFSLVLTIFRVFFLRLFDTCFLLHYSYVSLSIFQLFPPLFDNFSLVFTRFFGIFSTIRVFLLSVFLDFCEFFPLIFHVFRVFVSTFWHLFCYFFSIFRHSGFSLNF